MKGEDEEKVTPMSFQKSTAVVKMEENDELINSQFSGKTYRIEPSEVLSNPYDGIEHILRENFIKKCSKSTNLGDIVDELLADIDRVKRKGSYINRNEIKLEDFNRVKSEKALVSPRNLRPRKQPQPKVENIKAEEGPEKEGAEKKAPDEPKKLVESKKSSQSSKKSSQKIRKPKRGMSNYNYFYQET